MVRRYSAFLVRYWIFGHGAQRIEVTHIQSGEKTITTSLPAALDWIGRHTTATADGERAPPALEGGPR